MKILINNAAFCDDDDDVFSENYDLISELTSSDEATATDITKMFFKAASIEGYFPQSVI